MGSLEQPHSLRCTNSRGTLGKETSSDFVLGSVLSRMQITGFVVECEGAGVPTVNSSNGEQ